MNPVIKALNFRHACKQFDPKKKIPKEILDVILTAAHLSPSSFGLEAWKFLVISSEKVRKILRPACWNQPQITDASQVIVILSKPSVADPSHDYIKSNFKRRDLPEDLTKAYIEKYKHHMETEVFPKMSAYAWCSKQCYIALANIMTTAASEGIDSCPIEGFEKEWVEKVLNIDTDQYEVAVVVALGYRAKEQPPRKRHPLENIVEYR
ncbi:MAG: NAD(P)H-dependent oxidoreductase [Desulfobacula sp.]|jgi:nitroreductase|uniref:NAD(P)H-dependent oxidoreductase n=1 Tax=Desulfobacula sp. TaxID=2593537 RepID=UPI001D370262|nr:NAD(P)H-dependent oxidoreductase [Desulfobacula sp.]MBT3484247.1 NAD(P)H-dependent oxidoreductase [Desulfobacula sp.]MBT3804279.1 NAD(P)H-dependent oxidoreductase [Desulfobacula sp.]MBT4025597.1 NAD(P)H-dependent oxidoreductase [Desulfobacula sp.]MBT4198173.1 NAD(P)H-dependent oxidoreductase [Desulfobacula sp.]